MERMGDFPLGVGSFGGTLDRKTDRQREERTRKWGNEQLQLEKETGMPGEKVGPKKSVEEGHGSERWSQK